VHRPRDGSKALRPLFRSELDLHKIRSICPTNDFLQRTYIEQHNLRFAVAARDRQKPSDGSSLGTDLHESSLFPTKRLSKISDEIRAAELHLTERDLLHISPPGLTPSQRIEVLACGMGESR